MPQYGAYGGHIFVLIFFYFFFFLKIDRYLFYLAKLPIQNMIMKCPARAKETATKTIAGRSGYTVYISTFNTMDIETNKEKENK